MELFFKHQHTSQSVFKLKPQSVRSADVASLCMFVLTLTWLLCTPGSLPYIKVNLFSVFYNPSLLFCVYSVMSCVSVSVCVSLGVVCLSPSNCTPATGHRNTAATPVCRIYLCFQIFFYSL